MRFECGNYGFLNKEKMTSIPFVLYDLGVENRDKTEYYFDNHDREGYQGFLLQYTLSGKGIFEINDKKMDITKGKAFITQFPSDTKYYYSSAGEPWKFFYLHFDGICAKLFYSFLVEQYGNIFDIPEDSEPILYFHDMLVKCNQEKGLNPYEGSEFIYSFFTKLLKILEMPYKSKNSITNQAITYMKENYAKIDGIKEIADYLQISHEHLTRTFMAEIGISPIIYLTNLRIERSMYFLLNTSKGINEIAGECGFQNGNYFSKVFQKRLQCSPSEYRKRCYAQGS